MKRSHQYMQGYFHAWRDAISFVHKEAARMNENSARAAMEMLTHSMGRQKWRVKVGEDHPSESEKDAEIERLREALTLAANRLHRLTLECDMTDVIYYDAKDWTKEARAAVTGEST